MLSMEHRKNEILKLRISVLIYLMDVLYIISSRAMDFKNVVTLK